MSPDAPDLDAGAGDPRPVIQALGDVRDWIEHLHPHRAASHPAGTCEVCDYAYALDAEVVQLMQDQL